MNPSPGTKGVALRRPNISFLCLRLRLLLLLLLRLRQGHMLAIFISSQR